MLGQVQDAAEDAVESTLQGPLADNKEVGPQEFPYFQSRDTLYGQPASYLHGKQHGIGTYSHPQANIPPHIGNWPRTFGAQGE